MILFFIFLFLLYSVFLEIIDSNLKSIAFKACVLILSLFLFFRYGQGVDYFNYIYAFKSSNEAVGDFIKYGDFSNRFELGFSWLSYLFLSVFSFGPEVAISIFSLIAFIPLALFIKKYSSKPNLALLYYFSFFFLIYCYSGIRQGACISLFTYWLLPVLYQKKIVQYYIGVIILILIHSSAMLLLLLPIAFFIRMNKISVLFYLITALIIGTVIMPFVLSKVFPSFGAAGELVNLYSEKENSGFDVVSLIVRLIVYVPVYYYYFKTEAFKVDFQKFLFMVYTVSIVVYLMFSFNSLLSSRFSIYFRMMEPVLLTNIFIVNQYYNSFFMRKAFVLLVSIVMYVKSVQTELLLGEYKSDIDFYEIPYVTLFDKNEIFKYRAVNSNYYNYLD